MSSPLLILPVETARFWGWAGPPLGALYLASMVPQTRVWDGPLQGDPVEEIMRSRPPVVGITVHSSTRMHIQPLIDASKSVGAQVVVGGPHFNAHFTGEKFLSMGADFVIRGAGEGPWYDICEGNYKPTNRFQRFDINKVPSPLPWEKLDVMSYPPRDTGFYRGVDLGRTPRINMVTSRGCIGRCEFCTAWMHGMNEHTFEWLEPNILKLKELGVRHICFDDDLFGTNYAIAQKVCELLGKLGFVWQATTRIDICTEDLVRTMADGGCWQIAVGVESTSSKVLAGMNKKVQLQRVKEIREWTRRYGVNLSVLMMRGYPGQTYMDTLEDNEWLSGIAPDSVGCLGHTLVLPGTALWFRSLKAGYVDPAFWETDEPYLKANAKWRL